jgi:sugar/nucleoside kinase (ribokinase family)
LTDPRHIPAEDIRSARLFHLSGYALLADPQRSAALLALEIACRNDLTVTLDPGMSVPAAALDEIRALLPVIDILLPSLPEARHLSGSTTPEDCARALVEAGVQAVALKMGRDGCLIGSAGELTRVPGFDIEVRDTTGAGDHFAAGLLAGFLGGLDWEGAAVLGNAMGALAATHVGADTPIPSQAREVLELLRTGSQELRRQGYARSIQRAINLVESTATRSEEEGHLL